MTTQSENSSSTNGDIVAAGASEDNSTGQVGVALVRYIG